MENILTTTTRAKLETKRNPILPISIVVENLIRISNVGEDLTPSAPNATRWGMKLSYAKTKISNMVKRYRLLIKRRINCLCLNVSLAWNQVRVGSLTVVALTTWHIGSIQGTKKHKHIEGSNWKLLVHNRGRKWNSCNFKLFRYKAHFWCVVCPWNKSKFVKCWTTNWKGL